MLRTPHCGVYCKASGRLPPRVSATSICTSTQLHLLVSSHGLTWRWQQRDLFPPSIAPTLGPRPSQIHHGTCCISALRYDGDDHLTKDRGTWIQGVTGAKPYPAGCVHRRPAPSISRFGSSSCMQLSFPGSAHSSLVPGSAGFKSTPVVYWCSELKIATSSSAVVGFRMDVSQLPICLPSMDIDRAYVGQPHPHSLVQDVRGVCRRKLARKCRRAHGQWRTLSSPAPPGARSGARQGFAAVRARRQASDLAALMLTHDQASSPAATRAGKDTARVSR